MEKREINVAAWLKLLSAVAAVAFFAGIIWSKAASAQEPKKKVKVVYPKKTNLDFQGTQIEGDLHNPGEFYFQYRPEEKFDSLVKRRKNFHREMLRDVVLSR